jgi:hypothetical protein
MVFNEPSCSIQSLTIWSDFVGKSRLKSLMPSLKADASPKADVEMSLQIAEATVNSGNLHNEMGRSD